MIYSSSCVECEKRGLEAKYYGESSQSCYERAVQHVRDAKDRHKHSHMYNHQVIAHPNNNKYENMFRFDVLAIGRGYSDEE